MSNFVFQFEAVLQQRKLVEQQKQGNLAMIQSQIVKLQSDLRDLDRSARIAAEELMRNQSAGSLDTNYLAAHGRFSNALRGHSRVLTQQLAELQPRLEESRQSLIEAAKQRKIFEKLRDRRFTQWQADQNRREQNAADELAMQLSYQAGEAAAEIVSS